MRKLVALVFCMSGGGYVLLEWKASSLVLRINRRILVQPGMLLPIVTCTSGAGSCKMKLLQTWKYWASAIKFVYGYRFHFWKTKHSLCVTSRCIFAISLLLKQLYILEHLFLTSLGSLGVTVQSLISQPRNHSIPSHSNSCNVRLSATTQTFTYYIVRSAQSDRKQI